jgi:hypothetical protein
MKSEPNGDCQADGAVGVFLPWARGYNSSLSRSLVDPIFRPGVFDHLRRLFGRLCTKGDGRSFIVKDSTRVASEELIHRIANPVRIIHLQSKGL